MRVLPVFVINLDRRTDRWDAMTSELARVGVAATRIRAVDAKDMMSADVPSSFPSVSEYACLLSHGKALHRFLDSNRPAALILEDDVKLAVDLPTILGDVGWWPPGVGLMSLENCDDKPRHVGQECGRTPSGRMLRPLTLCLGAGGYLISRKAAKIVLGDYRSATVPIDNFLFDLKYSRAARRLKPLQVVPSMVLQKKECVASDLELHRSTRRQKKQNQLLRLCKKIPGLPYRTKIRFLRCIGAVRKEMTPYSDCP